MKKRIISLFLAITFLFSLCPAVRAEETASEVPDIEAQIRAYADSIDQSDAVSSAAAALAAHGMLGGGAVLELGASSALTATLLNSEVVQYGLAKIMEDAVLCMRQLDMRTAPGIRMGFNWYGTQSKYVGYMLTGSDDYPDNLDWLFSSHEYNDYLNSYDTALEWMVGGSEATATLQCTHDTGSQKTYTMTLTISDRFDFSTANSSGFKKFFSGIGMVMFREFDWNCTVTFDLTVPYSYDHCTHSSGVYHWSYDKETQTMHADDSDGYTPNNATYKTCTIFDGTDRHYFQLDNPIRLYHDKPWVVEYDVLNPTSILFSPVETAVTKTHPYIRQTGNRFLYFASKDYVMVTDEDGITDRYYASNYFGIYGKTLLSCDTRALHTFRLENKISPDGSNMIYLTVIDTATGSVCLEPFPMDDHYYYGGWMDETELRSEDNDWLSGKDIHINYFGTRAYSFIADYCELRIWEEGKDAEPESYYRTGEPVAPTCTQAGYTDTVCSACGHTIRAYGEPALGHNYTASVTEPTCTEGGYTTHTCTVCGDRYVSDHTDALGHEMGDWQVTQAPGCTEGGAEERHCQRCDYLESRVLDPLGHRYEVVVTEPGCTVGGYTTHICECGDSYVTDYTNPRGHRYEAVVTEPGCTVGGYTTYTCECGDSYVTAYTNPRGHCYEAVVTAPGCTELGYTTYTCAVCGNRYASDYVDALGHQFVDGRCTRCDIEDPNHKAPAENPFVDVPAGAWYKTAVLWAVEKGITNGTDATHFSPTMACDRGQAVTFLWRAAGKPEPETAENPFVDVKETDFYYKAVLWAVENGITTGVDATHFNPTGICSRAQAVTFLYRACGFPAVESTENPFADVPGNTWYTTAVLWAVENGITNGTDASHFSPDVPCDRAQVVTFLYRARVYWA